RVLHELARLELLAEEFAAELGFELLELGLDGRHLVLVADDVLAVALQEVADGLDADADRTGGLVLVDVLEAEVGRAGVFDDGLDDRIDGRIVTALEAG